MAMMLTACGSSSSAASNSSTAPGSSAAPNESGKFPTATIRIAHNDAANENNTYHFTASRFKELVEERTNGAVTVVIYPSGQYGGEREMFEAVTVGNINTIHVKSFPWYESKEIVLGGKYDYHRLPVESKTLMHPYIVTILDDFKGNRIELKNEYINSNNITITVNGSLGTSNKVSYSVNDYLQDGNGLYAKVTGLEHGVINSASNDIPIINDLLAAFLQGNRNSIANQKNSILFNGVMGSFNAGVSAASASMSLNPVSSVTGVVAGISSAVQTAGNSVLQMQAIQAKQKDISNQPPSLASMGSNSNFDFGNDIYGLYVIKKQIKSEYQSKLEFFFGMYGYKLNEVKIPNFHTRERWNYVETKSCIILGNINNEDLQELKNIFDNGITLWHTDGIGDYVMTNGVIA
jgi:hypothetical protein